jgi:glycosyltransferase involved in cell wall biosynthesis
LLLEAARELRREHNDIVFVFVGSGGLDLHNCEAALRDDVARHQLQHNVRFVGEVEHVEAFLQASDVFVFPSENDAFPLALVEAMACGLPCVATSVGGIGDIITHGVDGLLVRSGDRGQVECAIRDLSRDPRLRAALGNAAVSTVRDRYGIKAVADRYDALFTTLMAPSWGHDPAVLRHTHQ